MYASPAQKSTHPAEHGVRKRGVAHWQAVSPCSAKRDASWGKEEGGRCPLLLPSYRPALPVGRGDFSERQRRKINSASVKNAADENSSGALTAAPFFFPSYRPALPVGRGDFSERPRRKINSASVKNAADENSSGALTAAPFFFHRIDRLRRSGGAIFRSVRAEKSIPRQ